jgi:hypothetical protein
MFQQIAPYLPNDPRIFLTVQLVLTLLVAGGGA